MARRASSADQRRMGETFQEDVCVYGRGDHRRIPAEHWLPSRCAHFILSGLRARCKEEPSLDEKIDWSNLVALCCNEGSDQVGDDLCISYSPCASSYA